MAILKKDLAALQKDIKALEKKLEKLLKAYETGSKPKKAAPKNIEAVSKEHFKEDVNMLFEICKKYDYKLRSASNIRKKLQSTLLNVYRANYKASHVIASTKKAPAKKTAAKKKAVKKAPAKKTSASKKAGTVTATDRILKIIKRSKEGVDVPTLKKKTGFDDKKVRNIVFRASKEGRIKKAGRGIFVGK